MLIRPNFEKVYLPCVWGDGHEAIHYGLSINVPALLQKVQRAWQSDIAWICGMSSQTFYSMVDFMSKTKSEKGRSSLSLFPEKTCNTPKGDTASAIGFSSIETTKEKWLKPFEYFKYQIIEKLANSDVKEQTAVDSLLPWSSEIPESFKVSVNSIQIIVSGKSLKVTQYITVWDSIREGNSLKHSWFKLIKPFVMSL